MAYLIFVGTSLVLLVGFFVLTWYEEKRGVRYQEPQRASIDSKVKRIEFIATHVDFAAFTREESYRILSQVGHVTAHFSLQTVRAVERLLTRLVRHLRTKHPVEVRPAGETREFVKTLSDFKERLKGTMPEVKEME